MNEPILQIEKLSLLRGGFRILSGIDLQLHAGEVHALLGLNGCGKSSLAYTLMGCEGYTPASGRILLAGKDITQASITERARLGLTLAWQEPVRIEGIPIGKYVGLGAPEPGREPVVEALNAVALPANTYGYRSCDQSLSGGERKRVELASVFAMRPKVAILDEPDSGIDAMSIVDIQRLIRRMASEGSAVLLITHRPELVSGADTASLMCLGSLVYTGSPQETSDYYVQRCQPHLTRMGNQPWDEKAPLPVEFEREDQGGQHDR